jgi:hypothetical protein
MSGGIPLLPLQAFMACIWTTLLFRSPFFLNNALHSWVMVTRHFKAVWWNLLWGLNAQWWSPIRHLILEDGTIKLTQNNGHHDTLTQKTKFFYCTSVMPQKCLYLHLFFHSDGRLSGLNLNCNTIYITEIQCGSDQRFRNVSGYQFKTQHRC